MRRYMAKYWWVFLVRGLLGIVFGVLAFVMPMITVATLVIVWGAYAFTDGIVALWAAITGNTDNDNRWLVGLNDNRWLVGLQGVIGVAAGVLAFVMPVVTGLGLLMLIAAWSLAVGVLQLVAAVKLRKEITSELWLGLSGFVSILFAFFVIARPGEGALAVIWIIGSYSIIFGVILVAFAFRVRKAANA